MNDEKKPSAFKEHDGQQLIDELSRGDNPWMGAFAVNAVQLKAALQTPFIFVVAVRPDDGSFQIASHSDRQDIADTIAEEFSKIWQEKIVPMAAAEISPAPEASRIVRPDGRPFMTMAKPNVTGKKKRPPRRKKTSGK